MRWSLVVAVLFTLTTAAYAADYNEGGYASRTSVIAGGTISFHIATAVSPFELQIVNLAHPNTVLTTIGDLTSAPHDCTGLWETGCGWPVTTQLTVPATWPSGYYAARFPTGGGRISNILFVVRSANPGVSAKFVVIAPTHTYAAYNNFGGKSLDDAQSTNNQRAHIVSFNRPYADNNGLGRFPMWEQQFVDWMTTENRVFDVITDEDAEDATLVNKYTGVLLIGQSEYWTLPARQVLEKLITSGLRANVGYGNIAILGGSTMLWQARMNATARQLICYKNRALDPENGMHNDVVTVQWYDAPVYRPENMLIGGSFRNAGYVNRIAGTEDPLPDAERTPYKVWAADHWLLAGTGLKFHDTFGKTAAGTKVDGVIFSESGQWNYVLSHSDGQPASVVLLASIPTDRGYGTMTFHSTPAHGRVFNAGTRDWCRALQADTIVQQITKNVLGMLNGEGETWAPPDFSLREVIEDHFQMGTLTPGVIPGWEGGFSNSGITSGCDYPFLNALTLAGPEPARITRNFAPTNQLLPHVMLKFRIAVGQPQPPTDVPIQIITLSDKEGGSDIPRAVVEAEVRSTALFVRAASLADDGTRIAATEWQRAIGEQSLRWKTGGVLELTSLDGTATAAGNGDLSQRVNQISLGFDAPTGAVCMSYLSVRNPATPVYLSTSRNPSLVGDHISLIAWVDRDYSGRPTGTVTLRDGASVIASRPLLSDATFDVSGLSAGPHSFTATYDSASPDFDGLTSDPLIQTVRRRVRSDLDRDGKSDIVLRNLNPSRVAYWFMDGTTLVASQVRDVPSTFGPFEPVTSGDFGGDGYSEIIHFDPRPIYSGYSIVGTAGRPNYYDPTGISIFHFVDSKPVWRPFAAPDFNGDGHADLLLRNTDTGAIALWLLYSFQITTGTVIGNPGLNLVPIDAGNFGGNAIIFQNQTTGAISRWLVNGTTVTSDQVIATPAAGWKVAAVGDFDGDGFDDLALQNSSTRAVAVWLMDSVGTTVTKGVVIATPVEGWKVVGAGDYDGNGRSDLLLHNGLTNSIAQWQMNGTEIVKGWTVTTAPGWKPLGR
ncbi:MAG: hypothetical protein JWO97_1448 [Acidobacteria bacterium]|nr:hypothetical protein [Acidobacteriota bacterium]